MGWTSAMEINVVPVYNKSVKKYTFIDKSSLSLGWLDSNDIVLFAEKVAAYVVISRQAYHIPSVGPSSKWENII